jgi:predicted nucleic-acid-binding Zn-ribbon protein
VLVEALYGFVIVVLVILFLMFNEEHNQKLKDKYIQITCQRCGLVAPKSEFKGAASHVIGILLLILWLVPGILYYYVMRGKLVCPKCGGRL